MHFPQSRVIALDGSPQMIEYTRNRLRDCGDRLQFQSFDLLDPKWYSVFQGDVKCFVSSLVIHHLDGEGKRRLYKGLYDILPSDGALLIADIIKETNERDRLHMARTWEEEVARRSLHFNGDLDAYHVFREQCWNIFQYPADPVDQPSTLLEQLNWLEKAGFKGVNAFWLKAGHALFGGYKGQQ